MLFGLNEAAVATPAVATNLFNESYDFVAMEQEMIVESARAWNKIQYMTGEANCRLIHESITNPEGVETLMEAVVKGFFAKVKEFFVKLKNMIVEVFSKFMMWLNSKMKSEKDFATKYEQEILDKIVVLKEIEVKGYEYTHLGDEIAALPEKDSIKIEGADAEARRKSMETEENKYRGTLAGKGSIETGDFSSELFKYYRDNSDETKDITIKSTEVKAIFNELKSFSETKSTIEKDKNKIEKALNDVIKELNNAEKQIGEKEEGRDAKIEVIQLKIESLRRMATDRNSAFTAKIAAVKERADFGKKVVLAIKAAKPQNNSTVGGLFSMSI